MQRVPVLDGWRGLAIVLVILSHFGPVLPINTGRFGVELFFVLSGRLMAEILFVRQDDILPFFARRLRRVCPALAIFVTLMLLTGGFRAGDPSLAQSLSAITFTANYAHVAVGRSPVLDHIWSLCIEEHIYILLALLALAHRKLGLPVRVAMAVLIGVAIIWGGVLSLRGLDYYHVYWRSEVRGASILIGALAYMQARKGLPQWLIANPFVMLSVAVILNVDGVPGPIKYSLGTVVLALGLVSVERATGSIKTALSNPMLRGAGLISYSLYLWQQPFYKMGGGIGNLGAALCCALLCYVLIERLPRHGFLSRVFKRDKSPRFSYITPVE